jgi:ligand-binding sensor domain-containing protein
MVWDLEPDGERMLVATLSGGGVAGADGGVERRARETVVSARLPVRDVRSVVRNGGAVWVATFGGGVHRIVGGRARPVPVRGEVTHTHALAVGEGGVLVAHTGGLARADGDGRLAAVATGGLPSADVTSLARAFGALWVGTFDRGLARIGPSGRVEPQERALERWGVDRRVNDLSVTRGVRGRETLWIATDRGLFWHDGRRFAPALDAGAPGRQHVTSLHVDRADALWVTSTRQLSRYRDGRWHAWSGDPSFPVVQLHAVTTDASGRVWVGSLHGLYRFDPARGRFERHTTSSGALPVDWVTAVQPWGDGIVAGTYHGGLVWYDGARFRIEREGRAGIPAGWVNPHAMRWIDGKLYVGTLERGLVVGRSGGWTRLGVADGLPSDDVTDILPAGDGTTWVATRGGLARLGP